MFMILQVSVRLIPFAKSSGCPEKALTFNTNENVGRIRRVSKSVLHSFLGHILILPRDQVFIPS